MSSSLKSLKGGYIGEYIGDYYRVYKGDTRSLDYSSYDPGAPAGSAVVPTPAPDTTEVGGRETQVVTGQRVRERS